MTGCHFIPNYQLEARFSIICYSHLCPIQKKNVIISSCFQTQTNFQLLEHCAISNLSNLWQIHLLFRIKLFFFCLGWILFIYFFVSLNIILCLFTSQHTNIIFLNFMTRKSSCLLRSLMPPLKAVESSSIVLIVQSQFSAISKLEEEVNLVGCYFICNYKLRGVVNYNQLIIYPVASFLTICIDLQ